MKKHKIIAKSKEDAYNKLDTANKNVYESLKLNILALSGTLMGGAMWSFNDPDINSAAEILCLACGAIFLGSAILFGADVHKKKQLQNYLKNPSENEENNQIEK